MPDATALDQATAMIEKAWGRPIEDLEALAVRRPNNDPLLRSALHIRSALVITNNAVAVHQDRLHALTRPGHVPAFYDLERITNSAAHLRVAHAESRTSLQAISHVIEAREAAAIADRPPRSGWPRPPSPAPGTRRALWVKHPTSLPLLRLSARRRPSGGLAADPSGEALVAVGIPDTGAHRADQLLQGQLDAMPVRDPVLHHRALVALSVGLRADSPLPVGDHHDVAHRPRPPGGADLALQPGAVPVSARHPCSPFVLRDSSQQPTYDNRVCRSIPEPPAIS